MARNEIFNLENLRLLDSGMITQIFKLEMDRVVKDCMERPLLDKPRKVAIVFEVTPKSQSPNVTIGTIDCDRVNVEAAVESSVPKQRTQVYEMTPKHDGSLLFHPDIPDDPDGSTLYDDDAKRRDEAQRQPPPPPQG